MRRYLLTALCAAAAAAFALSACSGNNDDPDQSTLTPLSLGWVGVQEHRLRDEFGREVLLQGINARIEGLFDVTFDDGRVPLEPIPAFTADDAREMARLGLNFLRLPINWSGLEPQEGQFSNEYQARIDRVIEWCAANGIYVLVDFHQDAWSKEIGEDGAPLWAIVPPPERLLEGPLHDLDQRRISTQVLRAYEGFFTNQENIRDRFLPAWKLICERYRTNPAVVGFQPMNEPVVFHFDPNSELLYEFYRECSAAMRTVNTRHPLWVEPDSVRNLSTSWYAPDEPLPDPQVVYCPHLYPRRSFPDEAGWRGYLRGNFESMVEEARAWGGALVLGEWGAHPGQTSSWPYIRAVLDLSWENGFGNAVWLWKENSQGSWGFYDHNEADGSWTLRNEGVRQMVLPSPLAVPGRLLRRSFSRERAILTFSFEAAGGEAAPLISVPALWYPSGVLVQVNGQPVEVTWLPEAGRALLAWSGQAGTFDVQVTAAD